MRKTSGIPAALAPARYVRFSGFAMRVSDDLRKTVVFLGYADHRDPDSGLHPKGTGFLLVYEGLPHLVTARHVAEELQDIGWVARLNLKAGGSRNASAEGVPWVYHPDGDVDLAVSLFGMSAEVGAKFDLTGIDGDTLLSEQDLAHYHIGAGDPCFTIGLFHLLTGQKRNLPVVHTGTIALMPGDERVPIKDWRDESKTKHVEAYLVESQSMPGLSGSPVLVRPTVGANVHFEKKGGAPGLEDGKAVIERDKLLLLGVFQAAWRAKPSEVVAIDRGKPTVIPAGMGIVVPSHKLIEVLNVPEMKKQRAAVLEQEQNAQAASPSSLPGSPERRPIEGDAQHKERFTSLLDAAVQKPR